MKKNNNSNTPKTQEQQEHIFNIEVNEPEHVTVYSNRLLADIEGFYKGEFSGFSLPQIHLLQAILEHPFVMLDDNAMKYYEKVYDWILTQHQKRDVK